MSSHARPLHLTTAVVATAALLLQLVLVVNGEAVLDETQAPPTATAVARYVSYFTIQSNLLVAIGAWTLAAHPQRDGRGWRVLRLAGLTGITVTALVHAVLLRPLLDLEGASWLADTLLHVAVPLLAAGSWLLAGPRPRTDLRSGALAMLWPVAWLVWTLVVGAASGWYPYPFLDVGEEGAASVALTSVAITVLILAVMALIGWLDRRLPAPGSPSAGSRGPRATAGAPPG
ncbi:MAG: Pr6Pr family membrane protein [Actinomycetota bacterium]|nr:Pr6Pr family membrane protein [Actinomycetota bacterium]